MMLFCVATFENDIISVWLGALMSVCTCVCKKFNKF